MATKDEENVYLDVTGEPKEKYRKLVNKIKVMDNDNFVQSVLKFTFLYTKVHNHGILSSDHEFDNIVHINNIHRELCTSKCKKTFKKRINCICSEKLKYLYIWKHENFEKKIVIGCVCFENLYKFIINVYGHLPELMEHINVLKTQFAEAKRKINYIKCDQCEKLKIRRDEDDGTGICVMCQAKNVKEEKKQGNVIAYNKLRQENIKVMIESLAAETKRKKENYIARKRKENRRCYKCKDYNIPKDNNRDICCNLCVFTHGKHNFINCIQCDINSVHLVPKQVMYNGKWITGCDLYCEANGCRAGTRDRWVNELEGVDFELD